MRALALLLALVPSPLHARGIPPQLTTYCLQGSGLNDGCMQSPSALGGAGVQYSAFFTASSTAANTYGIARQSGQSYATRPGWNAAGVDYQVGPLVTTFLDPSVTQPANCAYASNVLTCSGGGGANLTINGYDFSANLNHSCVRVIVTGNNFTNETITNNRWIASDDGATDTCVNAGVVYYSQNTNTGNFIFNNNQIDMKADSSTSVSSEGVLITTSGQITMNYNSFTHINGRPVSINRPATTAGTYPASTYSNNYVEGFCYNTAIHGEFVEEVVGNPNNNASFTDNYTYNTVMQTSSAAPSESTALIYISSGFPTGQNSGQTVTRTSLMDHNTLVTNTASAGGGTTAAVFEMAYDSYASMTFTNNFVDPTSTFYLSACTGAPYVGGVYSAIQASPKPIWDTSNIYLIAGTAVPYTPGNSGGSTLNLSNCIVGT